MTINGKYVSPSALFQHVMAYLALVFGILTTQLQSIHLPVTASVILGAFGALLHPWTSIVSTNAPAQLPAPAPAGTPAASPAPPTLSQTP